MKTLIVMRHAKSDWSTAVGGDHDRALNARGRSAAEALGAWLRDEDLLPDQVLCSSARRTRETCERLELPMDVAVQHTRDLYLAEPDRILRVLRNAEGQRVLVIGHNPGIGEFAEDVLDTPPEDPDFARYPTGATLVATVDIATWGKMDWAAARADRFIVPRELT